MEFIYQYLPEKLVGAIGWAIFHSLWQGSLIAAAAAVLLLSAGKQSAKIRYALAVTSLFLIFFSAVYTFSSVYGDNGNVEHFTQPAAKLSDNAAALGFENPVKLLKGTDENSAPLASLEKSVERYLPAVSVFWLFGFFVFSFRFAGGLLYTQRLKNYRISSADRESEMMLGSLAQKIKLGKIISIYESAVIKVPAVIGYLKPVILLPLGAASGIPADQLEAIIAHELAHIKRYDFVINLLQSFIETILFYHPAVWWLSSVTRTERENSCDDIAVELCGNRKVYATALANINELAVNEHNLVLAATGNKNQLLRRINRMTQNSQNKRTYGGKVLAILVVAAVLIAGSFLSTKSFASKDASLAGFTIPNFVTHASDADNPDNYYFDNFSSSPDTSKLNKGKRTIKFREKTDGESKNYKAILDDGKITELYIDGEEVPAKDFGKYQGKIDSRLKEHEEALGEYKSAMKEYREKMKQFRDKMRDTRVYDSDRHRDFDFDFDFDIDVPPVPPVPPLPDMDELRESMRELRANLREDLGDIKVHVPHIRVHVPDFDNEEFREGMKEFSKKMENMKFDNEEFKEGMKHFAESMKNFKFDNEEFKANMDKFKVNMDKFKKKMEIFKGFINELKDQMIKDGVIQDEDELDRLKFGKDEISVNGKPVPENLKAKYLGIYKKHYGKDLTSDNFINFGDDHFDWDDD